MENEQISSRIPSRRSDSGRDEVQEGERRVGFIDQSELTVQSTDQRVGDESVDDESPFEDLDFAGQGQVGLNVGFTSEGVGEYDEPVEQSGFIDGDDDVGGDAMDHQGTEDPVGIAKDFLALESKIREDNEEEELKIESVDVSAEEEEGKDRKEEKEEEIIIIASQDEEKGEDNIDEEGEREDGDDESGESEGEVSDYKTLSHELVHEIKVKTMFPESIIRNLHSEFLRYCSIQQGTIQRKGMLRISYLVNNPLKTRIIDVMKFPKETKFQDFIEALGVFSKDYPQEDKLRFSFSLYDFDEDEFINRKDMEAFLLLLLGDLVKRGEVTDVEVRKIVDFLFMEYTDGKSTHGLISYSNFKKLVQYSDFGVSKICFEY